MYTHFSVYVCNADDFKKKIKDRKRSRYIDR